MKSSICILDDAIPAERYIDHMATTDLLNKNNFKLLLSDEKQWDDKNLLALVQDLYNSKDFTISGFTAHEFFFNYFENNIISPDVIVFDWQISGQPPEDSKKLLNELLENTFCLVAIYTEATEIDEIKSILEDEMDNYGNRLFILEKTIDKSYTILQEKISEKVNDFSFKYSRELKRNTLASVNNVLNRLSTLSFDQFVSLFGETGKNGSRIIPQLDFIDILSIKTRNEMLNTKFTTKPETKNVQNINDTELIRKILNFKLYHSPKDDIVRKGDVIKKDTGSDDLFLVISSDCHLDKFWSKNLGFLVLVPLKKITSENADLAKLLIHNKGVFENFNLNSLTSPDFDNATVLPGINIADQKKYHDYIISPRSIFSENINLPEGKESKSPLSYSDISSYGYQGEKRIRISEPYLSPLIQFIIEKITGYGVPNFNKETKNLIKEGLKSLLNEN